MAVKKKGKKMGRPQTHDRKAIAKTLLEELSKGRLVKDVCADLGVDVATVRKWAADDADFGAVYARAREEQAHAIAEDALSIADAPAGTSEEVARNRLRVDTRKWLASKIAPRSYGEKVQQEHTGKDGGAIEHEHRGSITWGTDVIPL